MENQKGFVISIVLLVQVLLGALVGGLSTYYGMSPGSAQAPTAIVPEAVQVQEVIHWGMVQTIDQGTTSKMVTFSDGVKVVVPKDCDAWVGVNLKITSSATGEMRCAWVQ